ncbi:MULTISPECIES: MDR family MFS transporter [Mesorhizobium]|uniref:MFS transporter n=1 Tax=Mesorhizobium japonicum R7A TaxID=935547 RepID=A0ABX6MZ33_9HYPH|nr:MULTISPECIES: MDR family MFS transporter [Mesorhizobium]ETA71448.1 arabinose efflux permease family protein [Mesorhizobium japonicum R7A]MBE1708280.1 MFS transporter [Mesorhizobium japonicum]MBE1713449.1 MFS transporter [Mesorhizobium japonicum]MUT19598.1 MFS transporter [Mesorhizobium japonicum]MUT25568.1 MFS transporter [Mesorhizobium japonicum]
MSIDSTLPDAPPAESGAKPDITTLVVYSGALIAMFMATIDMQIVVTALPTIAGELGNLHLFGWVGAAYLLSTAAVAPFYGKLGDMYGRKNVVLTAIALFLLGSLVCGMAWSMESLIAARVLQGIGGGGLMVSAFAMIGELFGPRDRAKYQGYSSAVFALSSVLGPLAGGYITSLFGWRWVFLVNLPIGIVVLAILAFAMRSRFNEKRHSIDYLGGLLLAIGTTAIVYWGYHVLDPAGPDLLTFSLPVVALAAIASFILVERRAEEPIVPLRLFGSSTVRIVSGVSVVAGSVTLGMFFYFALYMQTLTGLSPAEVGFLFLPASLTSMVISIVAGRVIAATGRYKWMPVMAMGIGGLLMIGFVFINSHTPIWVLAVMMGLFGISMGLQFQVLIVAIQAAAPLQDIGAVTSLITQARTIGASLGLALNGAVMTWALNRQTSELPADAVALLPDGLTGLNPHLASSLPAAIRDVVLAHYSSGFNVMFIWVAALYFVAMALTLLLEDIQIPKRG